MKYIRTKIGEIYELKEVKEVENGEVLEERFYVDSNGWYFLQDQIAKQADTIEELCDEFILHYDHTIQESSCIPWATYERRSENWSKNKEMLVKELNNESGRKAEVYGAIWTDKGLIYVAKMNEKGELELL